MLHRGASWSFPLQNNPWKYIYTLTVGLDLISTVQQLSLRDFHSWADTFFEDMKQWLSNIVESYSDYDRLIEVQVFTCAKIANSEWKSKSDKFYNAFHSNFSLSPCSLCANAVKISKYMIKNTLIRGPQQIIPTKQRLLAFRPQNLA